MKKFLRISFSLLTISGVLVYLLSCFTPYINPIHFWPMTFLALGFPVTAAVFLLFVITWFFINRKLSLILFVVLLCGFSNIRSCFAFHLSSSFNYKKDSAHLRVLTWNVRNFDNNAVHAETPDGVRRQMINYLKEANADVLFFQEYTEYHNEALYSNTQTMDSLGYHYYYASRDFITHPSYGVVFYGCAIFSKYPITDTGKIMYENLPVPEAISFSDIVFHNKKIRLFTTHLISMNLKNVGVRTDEFYPKYDSAFDFKNPLYQKLIHYDSLHAEQALLLKKIISQSPYPVIVAGDLNSVPASYVYHTIKGNNKDVFAEKGSGFGTTFDAISPTLRIDCIFADPKFSVTQWCTPELFLSDHFPVVADLHFN